MPPRTTPPTALHITAWVDPVVDTRGHVAGCSYVETFWLPVLGPTATFLVRRLAEYLHEVPEGFTIPTVELSRQLGLGPSESRHAALPRAIDRSVRFGVAKRLGPRHLAVRRVLEFLPRRQLDRLTPFLQRRHDDYVGQPCQALASRESM
jgi:hypothetical protein